MDNLSTGFQRWKQHYDMELIASMGLIVVAMMLVYAPTIGTVGFYVDAWYNNWYFQNGGNQILYDQYVVDRPGTGLAYVIGFNLFGTNVVNWQIGNLIWKIIGTVSMFLGVRRLWPQHRSTTLFSALFYAFSFHFIKYPEFNRLFNYISASTCISIAATLLIYSLKTESQLRRWLFVIVSAAFALMAYFVVEIYISATIFFGMIIIVTIRWQSWKDVLKLIWLALPHGMAAGIFLIWRIFFFESQRAATNIENRFREWTFSEFGQHLFISIENFLFRPLTHFKTYIIAELSISRVLAAVILTLIIVSLIVIHQRHFRQAETQAQACSQMLLLGFPMWIAFVVFLGFLQRHYDMGLDNRFILPIAYAVSITWIGSILFFIRTQWQVPIMLLVVALSIFTQLLLLQQYMRLWQLNRSLIHQVALRIPAIQDDAVSIIILPSDNMFAYFGHDETSMRPIPNLIYNYHQFQASTAFFPYSNSLLEIVINQGEQSSFTRTEIVEYDMTNTLIIYVPKQEQMESGDCMRLISPNYPLVNFVDVSVAQQYDAMLNLEHIIEFEHQTIPPTEIFGEPFFDWCHYFQQADLAQQQEDWQRIVDLYQIIITDNIMPNESYDEWLIYAQALFELGQPDQVPKAMNSLVALSGTGTEPIIDCNSLTLPLTECAFFSYAENDQNIVTHRFFDDIIMHNWSLESSVEVSACDAITIQSWWSLATEITESFSATVVLVESGTTNSISNIDRGIAHSETYNLEPEKSYFDRRTLNIPCDTLAGSYDLLWGIYNLDESTQADYYYLTTLSVIGS